MSTINSQHSATSDEPLFTQPAWRWSKSGDVGWWVRPEWSEALIGPDGLKLTEWRASGQLATVKSGPHRVVYRADLPTGSVYVKHFLVPNGRAVLRQWFRRGKGRNEGKRAKTLSDAGVPTITPIALGEQRKHQFLLENYLITPAIEGTTPLDTFVETELPQLDEVRQTSLRRSIARELATLTARLHEAGFLHHDFHPGNVLVRLGDDDHPQLTMIDLDALRVVKKVCHQDAQTNLAQLNHYFWLRSSHTDRARFLKQYLAARTEVFPDARKFARAIELETRSWAERLWKRWGRRCHGRNKYFATDRKANHRAIASRDLDRTEVNRLLFDLDAPFSWPATTILKDSRTTTVAETTLMVQGKPTRVIYKRFNVKKRLEVLWNIVRPTRAWRAWQAGQHLASRGVPTPQNLAYLARKGFAGIPKETYIVTILSDPSITLADYLTKVLPGLSSEQQRSQIRNLTRALGQLVRTLHHRSLSHRDLKSSNILIEGDPNVANPQLTIIDLVGVTLTHPLPRDRKIQNLTRINVSMSQIEGLTRTDRLRFLRTYGECPVDQPEAWKLVWREVERGSVSKTERNARSGRPLS